jgi:hypothetical protein
MPINLTSFIIRQPRVSAVNHKKTLPPSTSGTYTLSNAFTVKYNGSGDTAFLFLNAKELVTLVNEDLTHSDNLVIPLVGKQLQDLVDAINQNSNYEAILQGNPSDRAIIEGKIGVNVKNTVQVFYAKTAEYLIESETTAKLGSSSVKWVKNNFVFSSIDFKWINQSQNYDATGVLVPSSGITPIDNGANIIFVNNTTNPEFDLARIKVVVDEILVKNASSGIQFVNMPVLKLIISGTLQISINEEISEENIGYTISLQDNRINFLRTITNEVYTFDSSTSQFDLNNTGVGGVIKDLISITLNGNLLTPNVDFIAQDTTEYQSRAMSSGRIYFTQSFTDDLIAEYVLSTEGALISNDLIIKKNGTIVDSSEYVIALEAGFLNLNTPLFPEDVLTASYRSADFGQINDEILAGTPATVTNTLPAPYTITAGENDNIIIQVESVIESITLPIGLNVSLDEIIEAYNSQASNSFATKNTAGNRFIISSRIAGSSSSIQILQANGNINLGLTTGLNSVGFGANGGEFAFDLVNAPIEINSFKVPQNGNTFYIREANVANNYLPDTLIQINNDFYLVESSSTSNKATLFSNPEPFRITSGINDKFIIEVDDVEKTIILTSGDRTAQDIAEDINLIVSIASSVTINNQTVVKLESQSSGIGSRLKIKEGTANLMLGFTNNQTDSGLTDTIITVQGLFYTAYENPILRTTKKPVTFITETNSPEKCVAGSSTIEFNGVDVTNNYKPNTVIKINNNLYSVLSSRFEDGKTIIQLLSRTVAPIYPIDVIQFTRRPVFLEGQTELSFLSTPIIDLPITVKDNNVILQEGIDYTINENGTITLSDLKKLNSSSSIQASYTIFSNIPENSTIVATYKFFSNLNEGSIVKASYEFISPDQFFYDVVYENDIAEKILDKIRSENDSLSNPSSSGYSATAGGEEANSDSGNETPKWVEYKARIEDGIAKKYFDFFNNRINAFTNERLKYNGWIVGANNGVVTESDIQNIVNSSSRLFPQGYSSSLPFRVPALDGINQNDNGTTTGGTTNNTIVTYVNNEKSNINSETSLLNVILSLPTFSFPLPGQEPETTRLTSEEYQDWLNLVQGEINNQNLYLVLLNQVNDFLSVIMEEFRPPYDISFNEAKEWRDKVNSFISDTNQSKSKNQIDLTMDINQNSNITNRRDVTNPSRLNEINTFLSNLNDRLSEISNTLTSTQENLFNKRYSWLTYRASRGTGTVSSIKRAVDSQNSSNEQIGINNTILS